VTLRERHTGAPFNIWALAFLTGVVRRNNVLSRKFPIDPAAVPTLSA
jgi:hypothetical protein